MTRTYYCVYFKEKEYGMWIYDNDQYDTYEEAEEEYEYKKEKYKGAQLVKITEETLEEIESTNQFLIGDWVKIVKHCRLQGLVGQINRFDESGDTVTVIINMDGSWITYEGKFEDIEKAENPKE